VADNNKDTSLPRQRINYGREKFYGTGPTRDEMQFTRKCRIYLGRLSKFFRVFRNSNNNGISDVFSNFESKI
jgi:hypothetical protein